MNDAAKTKKARRPAVRREGERFRVRLAKGDDKLSLSVSPSATGYTLRARTVTDDVAKVATEHFLESQGDSFTAAKLRAAELAKIAASKGWAVRLAHRTIEDLI